MKTKLAIVGVGVISKYGISTTHFLEGLKKDNTSNSNSEGYKVPDFDIKSLLGKKVRYINRTTALSLIAMNQVLEKFNPINLYPDNEIGIAMGTNTGSLKITLDFANDTFTQEKPYYVDPSYFPQGILNYMAGNAAIRYGFKGVNVTISDGRNTGFETINYAANAIETSQCKTMLVAAVEDSNEYSEYIYHQQNKYLNLLPTEYAEGAVCLGIETVDNAKLYNHPIIAEIIDVNLTFYPQKENLYLSLKKSIDKLLNKHSISYQDIYAVSAVDNINCDGEKFETCFLNDNIQRITLKKALGDTLAATNLFQIASLLLVKKESSPQYCLLYTLDESNLIGCALLKI